MVFLTILFSFLVFSFQAAAQADVVAAIRCPSPSQAAPGQKLGTSISVWVRNQGNATAAKVVIDLFLSTDRSAADKHKVYKANFEEDVLLQGGREQIQNLAPGQTVKVTLHGWNKIPADTPPGNYYIGVLADPHNLNNEPAATRKNNMAFCPIRIGQVVRYRVTKVRAAVTPRSKVGPCPFRFNFTGFITTNGPCTVKYQWKRIDGATAPVNTLVFSKAATKKVTTYWQLGGAGKTYTKFWEALSIKAPNTMMSNKAYFNLKCTGGGGQTGLAAPRQLSPRNGSKFTHYPRKLTLKWQAIRGALYDVDIDCLHCKQSGKWNSQVGAPWKVVRGLRTNAYTFTFVADNPGRWRVRARRGRTVSAWSPWWGFSFNTRASDSGQTGRRMPDLIVSDIALVQGCKIKVTLKNIGTAGVPAAKYNLPKAVGVQMYKGTQPWGGIILKGFDAAGKLKVPGGTASWIWFPGAANLNLGPGTHTIRVVVDHNKNLAELNESNNSRTERLTCGSGGGTPPYANKPCGISLTGLSKTSGYPGETFRLLGTWGATQGPKIPCINKGKMNKLIVLGWSNTAIRVRIPAGLAPGTYRVGVYCHSLDLGKTYSSGWKDFQIKARGAATTAGSIFQVIYPTNSQHFALTNNKVVITVRFNRPVNRSTVRLGSSFKVRMETTNNTPGTLVWKNSREVVFTSTQNYGQLCEFNPDCFFKLIITPAVKDTSGQALDGDKNGSPGGTFEHDFTIVG
jgi:hypothetical protein